MSICGLSGNIFDLIELEWGSWVGNVGHKFTSMLRVTTCQCYDIVMNQNCLYIMKSFLIFILLFPIDLSANCMEQILKIIFQMAISQMKDNSVFHTLLSRVKIILSNFCNLMYLLPQDSDNQKPIFYMDLTDFLFHAPLVCLRTVFNNE